MTSPQRQSRIYALREHLSAHINMLREELNLFFDNPIGVAGHPDLFHTIEEKLVKLSEYQGALDALEYHFGQGPNREPEAHYFTD